ncbi:hypothetical protein Afil01_10170 [Actinorhabdospora filicis]|uniref:Ferric siderophore reductase C-terminal domain-containing protein n=1 Tax=Actinorhabdospora filicis TaxID=1785913 RepID=A0A9W6SFH7_9ACTN|nr:IucA/IucC family C-terminal-domain containing protein [Actinorhabdospora filicis]GLZ76210.1 hypothetical protein Afil01_10170 [Actinorhabdospora filicis]
MTDGLTAAATLGGFFALDPDPPRNHRPATAFYTDPRPEISDAHRALGGHEREVASVTHLGLAAKLISPVLAATLLTGTAPLIDPDHLPVWTTPTGGLRLGVPTKPTGHAKDLRTALLDTHFAPLTESLHTAYRLAPSLLWGNIASALANTPRVLPPTLRTPATHLIEELLATPPLANTFRTPNQRRTCCLFIRLPRGGACGDCPVPRRNVVPRP